MIEAAKKLATYEDLLRLDENERGEIIDGTLVIPPVNVTTFASALPTEYRTVCPQPMADKWFSSLLVGVAGAGAWDVAGARTRIMDRSA